MMQLPPPRARTHGQADVQPTCQAPEEDGGEKEVRFLFFEVHNWAKMVSVRQDSIFPNLVAPLLIGTQREKSGRTSLVYWYSFWCSQMDCETHIIRSLIAMPYWPGECGLLWSFPGLSCLSLLCCLGYF